MDRVLKEGCNVSWVGHKLPDVSDEHNQMHDLQHSAIARTQWLVDVDTLTCVVGAPSISYECAEFLHHF